MYTQKILISQFERFLEHTLENRNSYANIHTIEVMYIYKTK